MKIVAISTIADGDRYESFKVTFFTKLCGNPSQDSGKLQS
jgi:hypothetical protein